MSQTMIGFQKPTRGYLGGGGADPGAGVFDGYNLHEVEDEFHDEIYGRNGGSR